MTPQDQGYDCSYLVAANPSCGNGVFTLVLETWNRRGILAGLTYEECRSLHAALTQHLTDAGEATQEGHHS